MAAAVIAVAHRPEPWMFPRDLTVAGFDDTPIRDRHLAEPDDGPPARSPK